MSVKMIITITFAAVFIIFCMVYPMRADAHSRYRRHHTNVWDDLAHCESAHGKGSPNIFQFQLRTWHSMPERAGFPGTHTYAEQLKSAIDLQKRSGWRQWPACSRAIGVR